MMKFWKTCSPWASAW